MSDNTVFISYRRSVSAFIARAVFQDLRYHEFDVFMDVESIDAGAFDAVILNQIAARTHFVVILTPGAVERCLEPDDWLRREVEHAMQLERNIVPLLINNFDFRDAEKYLTGALSSLSRYNSLTVPHDYFEEAMARLRSRFLKAPARAVPITPIDSGEHDIVQQKIKEAIRQPAPAPAQLGAEHFYDQGHRRWEAGDFDGAIDDCTEAIRLNPHFAEAYNWRGSAYLGKDDYVNATGDFSEAIRLEPGYATAYYNRGLCHAASGHYADAMSDYNEALRLHPLFVRAYYSRATARTALSDFRGANADYYKYLDLGGGRQFGNQAEVEETMRNLEHRWQR
jgi:tetratricopeptide (TPR) repeat protein